ncbi:MAG: SRPBCC family protein [Nitrospiraceae bacterium]
MTGVSRLRARIAYPALALLLTCSAVATVPTLSAEEGPSQSLEVEEEVAGGLRARAVLLLPVPPQVVLAVLTDYEQWPGLFGDRIRITRLERSKERVITDLQIKRVFLPGELRLLCETREKPDGALVTSLIEGDFKQYVRRWTISTGREGDRNSTRAEMELQFELDSWMPDWLVTVGLRSELEEHFHILHDRVVERFKKGSGTQPTQPRPDPA